MKSIKVALWSYLALISILWWVSDQTDLSTLVGVFDWRNVLLQYSGMIGISVMSLAVILAVRPSFAERQLNGLDKMYRLHKWLGITGLVISITHWLIANGPKWAVTLGWLERRARPPRPRFPEGSLQQIFASQRGLAEGIGEWAFYVAVVMILLALIKYFPYRRFFQTHRILALVYLALVFHAVILLRFAYWSTPIGVVIAILLCLGSVSAVLCLVRKRISGRRVGGKVAALEWQSEMGVLAVDINLDKGWPGHQAGQFAFATFHGDEGPHPYTIASSWCDDGRVRFLIKALGDYTVSLRDRLAVGDKVILEGPYGQFTFDGNGSRQIWISGGIGITPFIARMQALAVHHDGRQVDLFHCTSQMTPDVLQRLSEDANKANVSLHLFWGKKLELKDLMDLLVDFKGTDVWFCGPAQFGNMLREQLVALGLPAKHFHQELFEMR